MTKVHPLPAVATAVVEEQSTGERLTPLNLVDGVPLTEYERATIISDVKTRLWKMVDYLAELSDMELVAASEDLIEWEKIASAELERRKQAQPPVVEETKTAPLVVEETAAAVVEEVSTAPEPDSAPSVTGGSLDMPNPPIQTAEPGTDEAGPTNIPPAQVPSQLDPLSSSSDGPVSRLEFQKLQADVSVIVSYIKRFQPDFKIENAE